MTKSNRSQRTSPTVVLDRPSEAARTRLSGQRRHGTKPELAIRTSLHAMGFRYRLHVRVLPRSRREADIVFGPERVVVDVRGCFWHGCADHATWPSNNRAWWADKIDRN